MSLVENNRKTSQHYNTPGHAHELTFSCYRGQPFLSEAIFCEFLAEALIKAMSIHGYDLWAYVFMPEHVHILVHPRRDVYSISVLLHSVKQSAARRALIYSRKNRLDLVDKMKTGHKHSPHHFWQDGGGYDRNVFLASTLIHMVKYIHNNPVRRGLVATPEEWLWSSARDWGNLGKGSIPMAIESFPYA